MAQTHFRHIRLGRRYAFCPSVQMSKPPSEGGSACSGRGLWYVLSGGPVVREDGGGGWCILKRINLTTATGQGGRRPRPARHLGHGRACLDTLPPFAQVERVSTCELNKRICEDADPVFSCKRQATTDDSRNTSQRVAQPGCPAGGRRRHCQTAGRRGGANHRRPGGLRSIAVALRQFQARNEWDPHAIAPCC